jgi:hypothetical protein
LETKILENINHYIIGNEYDDLIGINSDTLNVYILSNDGNIFVNSTIVHLENCIKYFTGKIDLENDIYDENKRHEITKEIKKGIKEIDKKALDNKNNWWPLILEQVMDGLL